MTSAAKIVVVESPAKAKTIGKYLGKDYEVVASFGHVRDLPAKDGSVRPEQDFSMTYEVEADSKKHIAAIAKAVRKAEALYLATDPDREGEAISWHVLETLKEQKALREDVDVKRIVFHEITKKAVLDALTHPRKIDMDLVNAQQARRALDYLVGFTLSPVLWRKLPGSRSAGRVQSVALRLICERDEEIEKFISQEYWDITAQLLTTKKELFTARLTHFKGEKLEKFSIPDEAKAESIAKALRSGHYTVAGVEPKQLRRHPPAPFTTSTLQQEASRKLGFSAKKTMQLAQKLYEGVTLDRETVGLITYMRTDGVQVSNEAVQAARQMIGAHYGPGYVPDAPRVYKTKAKNAQEAHEAVRPTDIGRAPGQLGDHLDRDMLRLYELIWKRMVASQMESAVVDQVSVDIATEDKQAVLRATGSTIVFDGYLRLYQEDKDDDADEEDKQKLPVLKVNEAVDLQKITPQQHFTEPPPRFTEASLVKKLEELGIGRPSTYASIISVLQERSYVRLEKKRFVAETLGRLVSAFLVSFFERYVQYGFTADLENQLDDISAGERNWKAVLREFWREFAERIEEGKALPIQQILETLDTLLESYLFGRQEDIERVRQCPECTQGRLRLKTGRYGAYLGCSNYPQCSFRKPIVVGGDAEGEQEAAVKPAALGNDPSGVAVTLKKGPYGYYVQLGEGKSAKRAGLPKNLPPDQVTLEKALALLALPREVGIHPETKKQITAGIGRYGAYLLHDGKYTTLPPDDDVLSIGINRAVTLLAEGGGKGGGSTLLRSLGAHPDGAEIGIYKGRYGPYLKHGKANVPIPKKMSAESLTLEQALELIAARAESSPAPKRRAGGRRQG